MPRPAGFVQAWRDNFGEVVVMPIESDARPFPSLVPLQCMETSNYKDYGDAIPRLFKMVEEGGFDEMMKCYWQIHPARMANLQVITSYSGATNFIRRMVWKYQAWLAGFNGGPSRQPIMRST